MLLDYVPIDSFYNVGNLRHALFGDAARFDELVLLDNFEHFHEDVVFAELGHWSAISPCLRLVAWLSARLSPDAKREAYRASTPRHALTIQLLFPFVLLLPELLIRL